MFDVAYRSSSSKMDNKDLFFYYCGLASYYMEGYEQAAYFLRESIRRFPDHEDSYYFLGMSLKKLGLQRFSEAMLKKAISLRSKRKRITSFDLNDLRLKIF